MDGSMKDVLKFISNQRIFMMTLVVLFFSLIFCSKVNATSSVYEFSYTGDYQTFVVPISGIY